MAGEFLPPVVTVLEADIGDFAAKIAAARALLAGLGSDAKDVAVNIDVRGMASAAAKVAALGAATTTAAAAAGSSIPVWHRWLDLIHFGFAIFGENIVADAIGLTAFGLSAVANIGPAVEAVGNLGQTYAYLNKNQMATADSMTLLKDKLSGTFNEGVFAVYQQVLGMVNDLLGKSGTVTLQATQAFEQFAAELRIAFGSPQWAEIFGRSSSLVRTDLEALFNFLTALIQLIPGLLHDFNFLGLGFLNGASLIMRGLAYISEADPVLTRFAYGAYLAYRAWRYLWVGMGTGPGPIQRMVTSLRAAGTQVSRFAQVASSQGLGTAVTLFTGIDAATLGTAAAMAVLVGGVILLTQNMHGLNDPTITLINGLQQMDNATGDNVVGYEKLANQLNSYVNPATAAMAKTAGTASRSILENTYNQQKLSQAQIQAATTARNLGSGLNYLEQRYHLTQAQAYALAQTVGVNLDNALGAKGKLSIQAYMQALNAAKNPLTAVQYDMAQASNSALQLDDQVTALTNAFNVMLTPLNNVIQGSVTYSNDLQTLATDLKASNGQVGLGTAAQKASASAMAQAAQDAIQLATNIKQQTGSTTQAMRPLQQLADELLRTGAHGAYVTQELQAIRAAEDALRNKDVYINFHIVTSGTVPSAYIQGESGHAVGGPMGYASGTSSARSGWAMVGERGPELVHLRGGETIVPNHALAGYADGAGYGGPEVHNHIYIDGREVQAAVAQRTFQSNFKNGSRLSGGRPTGILRPR